jgi:hypothetical protein
MNAEKLQALVKQATVKVNNPYVGSSGNVVLDCWEEQLSIELLADLIVKECAKFVGEHSGYDNANNAWHPEPEDILTHFGVEE